MSSNVPEEIGPYRVERRIGRGGMGEVYRGHDGRLDRPVALKRIRPESGASAVTRERFRREGRSLARVRHASVVAVYDWIEGEEDDWLVMELLEGRSLRKALEDESLSLLRTLRIARDIAAGLAAVHAQGIVHRDLKPDNVMLVSGSPPMLPRGVGEQVKILDFGLAKRIISMDGLTLTESISKGNRLVGTVQFMSPEQASGHRVDERSDLFSLGVILYTMLTRQSPFGTGNVVEILTRICTLIERPVHEVEPAVPRSVSEWVRRLLEKDPKQRPQSSIEVLAALDTLDEGLMAGRPDQELLATLPGCGSVDAATAPWLEEESWILKARSQETIDAEDPRQPPDSAPDPGGIAEDPPVSVPRKVAAMRPGVLAKVAAGLGLVALGGFGVYRWTPFGAGEPLHYVAVPQTTLTLAPEAETSFESEALQLKRLAVHQGILRGLQGLAGIGVVEARNPQAAEDPVHLARTLGAAETLVSELECYSSQCQIVVKRILAADGSVVWSHRLSDPTVNLLVLDHLVSDHAQGAFASFERRAGEGGQTLTSEDYETFLRVVQQYEAAQVSSDDLVEQLVGIRETSPGFIQAYVLAAALLRQRFAVARAAEDLEAAVTVLQQALEVSPGNPLVLRQLALVLIDGGRLDEAEETLEAFARYDPGDATYYSFRAMLLERRGRGDEALAMMRQAVLRQGSIDHRMDLAMMEYRLGNLEAARTAAEAALELDPTNYGVLSRTAEIELVSGSLERSAELYEALIRRAPGEAELTNLGVVYLLLKRLDDAVEVFDRALDLAPSSPFASLNLADAFALKGNAERADEHYEKALAKVRADPAPDQLLTIGAQALAHLGRNEEAVAAVQRAIRLEPDNPQIQFESALVYIVVGERTSALLHARRALELGVERRWFDFPWFDPLRDDLEG